jgi:acetolactate synthase I/II/III large subunit
MAPPRVASDSAAGVIARFLKARGVDRIFGLCGGHIMPIWMRCDAEGIRIVDVRDERAAVYMAHAHAALTGGLGVALITAGPGLTNAVTGIANAHVALAPVLVLSGLPPRPQENRGALQDLPHTEVVRPLTRYARTVREPALVLQELDQAVGHALGQGADPGPVYLDFPTDTLRTEVPRALQLNEYFRLKASLRLLPDPVDVAAIADRLWSSRRPLIISGRGARGAKAELGALLDRLGALYLDTGESRGLVPDDHPSVVAAMRGTVLGEADLVLTVGRRLDFQLAYGSPAVFGPACFVRIADCPAELCDNRRGDVEMFASPPLALAAIVDAAGQRPSAVDRDWTQARRAGHEQRLSKLRQSMRNAPDGSDGRIHPNRLLAALQERLAPDSIVVADGGDFLSFARVGLSATTYLDPGPLGCIGIGTPFGVAASLAFPGRQVVVATGDGAFGFNAMEIDTAVRHGAKPLIVIANNGAWQIEVQDQYDTYGKVVGTRLQHADYATMARAFGLYGERVVRTEDLPGAIDAALENRPSLLDVVVTSEVCSSDGKSGLAWVPDLQPLAAWDEMERHWRTTGARIPPGNPL